MSIPSTASKTPARPLFGMVLAAFLLASQVCSAQATDPIAATELFRQGRQAMTKGDFTTACHKFEDSARLDAKVGTLLNLAECQEHLGKIAAARQNLQRAVDLGRAAKDDRVALAEKRFAAIDKRVPRLTVTLDVAKVEGARVVRDDVELGAGSLGTALPVEPGEHVVTVSAPRHEDRAFRVTVAEAETKSLAVGLGAELPEQPSTAAGVTTSPGEAKDQGGSGRTIGYVVVGVGVAAVGAGAIFALMAMSDNDKSKETCEGNVCDEAGLSARNDALAKGNVATGLFIGGGVLLAAGAVLVLTAPGPARKTARLVPFVTPRSAGLGFSGAF